MSLTVLNLFMKLKNYEVLRIKFKGVRKILNHYPEKCYRVKFKFLREIYVEFMNKGLTLDLDKGLYIINYFINNLLIRTEKWYLSEFEAYFVNHHKLVP